MSAKSLYRRLVSQNQVRPIAKAALEPLGGTANPDQPAVNPLMVAGLFVS